MKNKNLFTLASVVLIITIESKAQNANTNLSNLTVPTQVNITLLPGKDSSINLGYTDKNWKNIYLKGKIYFGSTPTIYSVNNNDFFAGPNAGIKLKYLNGQRNTGIGSNALYYGGYSNTAVGWDALEDDTTGAYNAAVGALALLNNTSGNENTAVGNGALYKNDNGYDNTGIGVFSLSANFSGSKNAALGSYALYSAYESESNTAIGYQAQYSSTTASNNSSLGYNTLYNCTAGFQNTAVGYNAGSNVSTGSDNTFIGTNANCGSTGRVQNSSAFGYAASVTSDNHIRIGNTGITSIGGQVGWTNFSDERIKINVKENVPGLAFINLLKPVTYNFNMEKEQQMLGTKDAANWTGKYAIQKIKFTGFMAQQVEAAAKKIGYDFSGVDAPANDKDLYGLRYGDFVVPLVKAVQELSKKNDDKDAQIQNLQKQIDDLKALVLGKSNGSVSLSNATLQQNVPNPFKGITTVSYNLPDQFSRAQIVIRDINGKTLKQINISGKGLGNVQLDASTLAAGAYNYSLIVDGKIIDTKQMISGSR